MNTDKPYVSLIPYLQSSPVYLTISVCSDEDSELERVSNPFVLVDDSSPIGKFVHGSIVTDGETIIQELFLFVQRSKYHLPQDPLVPLTNRHIKSMWQRALGLARSRSDSGLIRLSALEGEDGTIKAFGPLFFCKHKRTFFEPPCPVCSGPLILCEDDTTLSSAGLPTFSGSLSRYLYCRKCYEKGQGRFYVYEKEKENSDLVKDRVDLIKGLSSLEDTCGEPGILPCLSCDQWKACFGPEDKAVSRVAVFSFYPFHMLPFEAMSLHCEDFLALASGARPEELLSSLHPSRVRASRLSATQGGGARPMAFFSDPEKHFLEILHIKLTLLRQLADWIATLPLENLSPLNPICLDSFWVNLPEASDSVPYFWTFKLKPLGIVLGSDHNALDPHKAGANKILFIGLAWFYVLLRNAMQGMDKVIEALKSMIVDGSPVSIQEFIAQTEAGPGFAPINIFWEPQDMEIPSHCIELWNSCMELGWKLIRAGLDDTMDSGVLDTWFAEIDGLRDQIKGALFAPRPAPAAPAQSPQQDIAEDRKIGALLADIAAKWEADLFESISKPSQEPTTPSKTSQEVPAHPPPLASDQEATPMEETIIVAPAPSQGAGREQEAAPRPGQRVSEGEEIPETIIFSSPNQHPSAPPTGQAATTSEPPAEKQHDKDFGKTSSMTDRKLPGLADEPLESQPEPGPIQPNNEEAQREEEEEIPQTIIIKPEDR